MKMSQEKDALLALISTLSVVFVILFFSIAYFLTLRSDIVRREAYVEQLLAEQRQLDMVRAQKMVEGSVAGAETELQLDLDADF